MDEDRKDARLTAELLAHLGRVVQNPGPGASLSAAQWMALRFFDCAHPMSRTPSAFARFHGTTRGTASQIVKTLTSLGLLSRQRDPRDRRSLLFAPTGQGRAMLADDPLLRLERAIDALPAERREGLSQGARAAARTLIEAHGCDLFGICPDCAHLGPDPRAGPQPDAARRCRRLDILVEPPDLLRLCAHFTPHAGAHDPASPART